MGIHAWARLPGILAPALTFALLAGAWSLPPEPAPPTEGTPASPVAALPPAPQATRAPPPPPLPSACLANVTDAPLPLGSLHQGRVVARNATQRVSADNGTVLAAMALAAATGERLQVADLTDVRRVVRETCSFDLVAHPDASVLDVAGLVADRVAAVDLTFETACEHEVRLPDGVALAAIALARSGMAVHVRDALTEKSQCRTSLVETRVTVLRARVPDLGRTR